MEFTSATNLNIQEDIETDWRLMQFTTMVHKGMEMGLQLMEKQTI